MWWWWQWVVEIYIELKKSSLKFSSQFSSLVVKENKKEKYSLFSLSIFLAIFLFKFSFTFKLGKITFLSTFFLSLAFSGSKHSLTVKSVAKQFWIWSFATLYLNNPLNIIIARKSLFKIFYYCSKKKKNE